MNRTLVSASIAVLACLLSAGIADAQSKEFSQTLPLASGGKVSIKTYKGSIHVSPWDRAEVSVMARIAAPEGVDDAYAEASVQATRVEFRARGDEIVIRSDYDDVPSESSWFGVSRTLPYVHYEIHVPRQVDLRLEDNKSDIEVYELSGDLNLNTYKGKMFASGLSGRLRIETYKGRADLQALRGSLDIETYKGEVVAEALEIDGASRLNTYKGEIQLSIPQNQALTLVGDMGRRGSFTSDFNLEEPERESRRKYRLNTSINQGGPRLDVSSYKGDIRLKKL